MIVVSPSFRWIWGPPTQNHRVLCYRCRFVASPAATDSPVLFSFSLFPHIFVWGSCFWFCTPAFSSCPPPPPAALLLPPSSSSYNLLTHNSTLRQLAHTRLYSHTLSSTCHHTTCSNTTTCSHTIQLTHNSTHTTCSHTTLLTQLYSHCYLFTQLVITQLAHTQDWLPSFHVAGVVLGDIDFHFAWQAWHLWHWTGSGGALGPEWPGWSPRLLAWQPWHFATSPFVSRGRRGTW